MSHAITFKELLSLALGGLQSLANNDTREMPVDRIGAAAYAQTSSELASLGVDLIALKYANREASRDTAAHKLALVLGWRSNRLDLNSGQLLKVARWAIGEWLNHSCMACKGAKEAPAFENVEGQQPMQACPTCQGTGLRIWTDEERNIGLGGKYGKPLDTAHKFIGAAEAQAVRGAKQMLERWAPSS
jgi:Zn finger protein HypA/HybF involved in hydrogenase expression